MLELTIDLNAGNSSPLCSKNGLICSINGFIARSIIASIFENLVSNVLFNKMGISKSTREYIEILPFSSNSQTIK